MTEERKEGCGCSCCNNPYEVLMGDAKPGPQEIPAAETPGMSRAGFLKVVALGAVGLSTVVGTKAFAAAKESPDIKILKGGQDVMVVD